MSWFDVGLILFGVLGLCVVARALYPVIKLWQECEALNRKFDAYEKKAKENKCPPDIT